MSLRMFYVDESYDEVKFCLNAITIRHEEWRNCFNLIKAHRTMLRDAFGIPMHKELHARDLIGGRGSLANVPIPRYRRAGILDGVLELVANLPSVKVLSICLPQSPDAQLLAWDRLFNRIERMLRDFDEKEGQCRSEWLHKLAAIDAGALSNAGLLPLHMQQLAERLTLFRSRAIIVSDEGKEKQITAAFRKMHVVNYIPSMLGQWEDGSRSKNIVLERIIEDPFFKQSHRSYFLQLADCVAFALLKSEVAPTKRVKRYNVDKMFEKRLKDACHKPASRSDWRYLGIVRK